MPPPLTDFVWSPWQAAFIRSVMRERKQAVAIRGGIGSGKSVALVFLAGVLAVARPGARIVLIMDTYRRLDDVHQPFARQILPALGLTFKAGENTYSHPNGSAVLLRPYFRAATQPGAKNPLEGGTIHAALVDEAGMFPTPEVWVKANTRARQVLTDVNGVACDPVVVLCGYPEDPCWWVDEVRRAAEDRVDEGGDAVPGLRTAEFYPVTKDNEANLASDYIARQAAVLDADELEALIHNRPRPRRGQVLSNWRADEWPAGNVVNWPVDRSRPTRLALDFGFRFPAVGFIQHDEARNVDVIVDELCPDDVLTPDLIRMIRAKGYNLTGLVGDPAGGARNAQTGRSDVDLLAMPVAMGGLGLRMKSTSDPVKRDIRAGIIRLRNRIEANGKRSLVMVRPLWEAGIRDSKRRSIASAIQGYRYSDRGDGEPVKDGRNDHAIDLLRYDSVNFHWFDHPLDGRLPTATAAASAPTRARGIIQGTGRWQK